MIKLISVKFQLSCKNDSIFFLTYKIQVKDRRYSSINKLQLCFSEHPSMTSSYVNKLKIFEIFC